MTSRCVRWAVWAGIEARAAAAPDPDDAAKLRDLGVRLLLRENVCRAPLRSLGRITVTVAVL